MLTVVVIMFCGIAVGYLLRKRNIRFISHIITVLIWLLLFLLGIEVGINPLLADADNVIAVDARIRVEK